MYKPFLITFLATVIILSPVSAQAPASTGGSVSGQAEADPELAKQVKKSRSFDFTQDDNKDTQTDPQLDLIMPLNGASLHTDYSGEVDPFTWEDLNSGQQHSYGVTGDRFVYQPDDTWFVYGLFGPIEAIKYDWNIKYPIWGGRHNGIDFALVPGTPVLAASGGEVIFAGLSAGNTVVVKTGNFQITYGHLQLISVRVGERVSQGQPIGHSGSSDTPNPHLHFQIDEYRMNSEGTRERWAVNPAKYLFSELKIAIMPDVPTNRYSSSLPKGWNQLAEDFRW